MNLRNSVITRFMHIFAVIVTRPVQLVAGVWARRRGYQPPSPDTFRDLQVDGVTLREKSVVVDGYAHLVTEAGNSAAGDQQTIVLMGGIPTDSSESCSLFSFVTKERSCRPVVAIVNYPV